MHNPRILSEGNQVFDDQNRKHLQGNQAVSQQQIISRAQKNMPEYVDRDAIQSLSLFEILTLLISSDSKEQVPPHIRAAVYVLLGVLAVQGCAGNQVQVANGDEPIAIKTTQPELQKSTDESTSEAENEEVLPLDPDLVQKVIDAYAHDPEGLTPEECKELTRTHEQANALCAALGGGEEGQITDEEDQSLRDVGFSSEFMEGVSGEDGKALVRERELWKRGYFHTNRCKSTGPDYEETNWSRLKEEFGDDAPEKIKGCKNRRLALAFIRCTSEVCMPQVFTQLDESLRQDRSFVLAAVRKNNTVFRYIDEKFKRDREIVRAALRENRENLVFVDEPLRKDWRIIKSTLEPRYPKDRAEIKSFTNKSLWKSGKAMITAIEADATVFQHADESLQKSIYFVFRAAKKNAAVLLYADESFRNDKALMLQLFRHGAPGAFEFLDESLRMDREFVLEAIKTNNEVIRHVDKRFWKDREVVLAALSYFEPSETHWLFDCIDESLKNDRDFMLEAVKQNDFLLRVSNSPAEPFIKDVGFMREVHRHDSKAISSIMALSVPKRVRDALDIKEEVKIAPRQVSIEELRSNESLKKDRAYILDLIDSVFDYRDAYNEADESLKKDRRFIMEAVKRNYNIFKYIDESFKKDREIVLTAIESEAMQYHQNHWVFTKLTDESLKKDRGFILEVIKINAFLIKYIDESFKSDREIVLTAVKKYGGYLQYADESLRQDREIVMEAVRSYGESIQYADESFKKDREIVLAAVKTEGAALKYVDESFRKDREIVLIAVKSCGYNLEFADESLRSDREIVLAAVKQSGDTLRYADGSLWDDREMFVAAVSSLKSQSVHRYEDGLCFPHYIDFTCMFEGCPMTCVFDDCRPSPAVKIGYDN